MSVTAESFNNTSYLLGSDCSPEANLVREALAAKGLETPMSGKSLSREEKYNLIKASMTDVVNALGLDLTDDSLVETPYFFVLTLSASLIHSLISLNL